MKPKEAQITKSIRMLLKTLGIFHWKNHGGLGSAPGLPDLCAVYKGRCVAIEVKTEKGRLSSHQQLFIDRINESGGLAFVARSVDDVIRGLGIEDRFFQFKSGVKLE
jgi:hypothetical protein